MAVTGKNNIFCTALVTDAFYCCSSSSISPPPPFPARIYQLFNTDLVLDLAASELWQSALKEYLRKSRKSQTKITNHELETARAEKDITVRSLKITKYPWLMQQVKGILSCQP